MDNDQRQIDELTDRLARAESQLRQLRTFVGVLMVAVIALLFPPTRKLLEGVAGLLAIGAVLFGMVALITLLSYAFQRLVTKRP